MPEFGLTRTDLDLPEGAWAQGWRTILRADGRTVLGFTQGRARNYLFPVTSPAGFAVTAESPADHPHHNSIWVGADHVHAHLPAPSGRTEQGTYNFYVDDIFQGRAPGRIREIAIAGEPQGPNQFRIEQSIEWRGPVEWGADAGRRLADESRTATVTLADDATTIDLTTRLRPTDRALTIGPTRHAWFGIRIAEAMTVNEGGRIVDAAGRFGTGQVSGQPSSWIDLSGPVGGGHRAGIAIFPDPRETWNPWFATDWGTVAVNPFVDQARTIEAASEMTLGLRILVHDGLDEDRIAEEYAQFTKDLHR